MLENSLGFGNKWTSFYSILLIKFAIRNKFCVEFRFVIDSENEFWIVENAME